MTVDKKQLFKTAWGLAKNAAWSFGGKPVEYFAECLKKAWSFVKPVVKKKVGDWLEHILTADAKLDAIMQMESEII